MRRWPILLLIVLFASAPASAQTRLSMLVGGIVPFGDLDDIAEPSSRFGLRAEFQPVNALGQRRLLSFVITAAYTGLDLDAAYEAGLISDGTESDAHVAEVSGGVRVYSGVAPLFATGSLGYARYRPGGDADGLNGIDASVGLGFMLPLSAVNLEVEGALHKAFLEDDNDLSYLSALLGVGLPF